MWNKVILLLAISVIFTSCEKLRFDNYTLYKIIPKSEQQIKLLQELQNGDNAYDYDFWNDPVKAVGFVNIMSTPQKKAALESFLDTNGVHYEISISNVQEAVDKETVNTYTRNSKSMSWNTYYKLSDIEAWMSDMAAAYSDIVSEVIGGETYEGRQIKGLKISHGPNKRVIVVESGIHSREWISPSMACYIINDLLTSTDAETMAAARDFEWYIFPVTNPDGYVWTHEGNRLWRKNRRPVGSSFGIDLNRNWNINWLELGSSVNPASDTYAGPGPFSEPETRSFSKFLRSIGDRIDLYLSFHSYSQLLMFPFGNSTQPLANYDDAMNIGRRAMGALSVRYGTQYVTGNIAEAIYHATGSSVDWVKEELNVPLAYCYELRDKGTYGFILPTDQILPNHLETMDSVIEIIHQAKRFGYLNSGSGLQASLLTIIVTSLAFFWLL